MKIYKIGKKICNIDYRKFVLLSFLIASGHPSSGLYFPPVVDDFPLPTRLSDDEMNLAENSPHIKEDIPFPDLLGHGRQSSTEKAPYDLKSFNLLDYGDSSNYKRAIVPKLRNSGKKRMMSRDRMSHLFRDRRGMGMDRMNHLFRDRKAFGMDRMNHLFRDKKAFGMDRMNHLFRDRRGFEEGEEGVKSSRKRFQKKGSVRPLVRLWILDHMTRRSDGGEPNYN